MTFFEVEYRKKGTS